MRFLSLTPFLALPALLVAAHQPNDVPPDPSYYDAPTAINNDHEAPLDAQKVQQDPWENGPLVKRWQQWVRRQDTESSDDDKTTETKSETQKTEETTQDEPTTTEEKITTTEDKPTTTDEPTSTTEESTTQETSTLDSSSTVESTSTEPSASSTSTSTSSSSITATEPGASCYSTTVSTSVVCSITTDGHTESASCITNRMTSSTCSPGLFCTIHPDSGATVCMEQHNEIGTEGIVVATFFGACIAGCMAVLVGMCLRDKRREKKWQSIQRVRTLKQAKREERTNLMAGATPPNVI